MGKSIVLVEDDPAILDVMQIILGRAGYIVSTYHNGATLKDHSNLPDLYIIDKQLSGIDGLEICKQLKNNNDTAHLPVIILSASPRIENMVKLAGADAFIEKPFAKKLLIETIEALLKEK